MEGKAQEGPPQAIRAGKSRRPRWTPSGDAKALLETIFSADSFPTFTVRNQLAEQLGIDSRQVQIWFQNRRQRERIKLTSGSKDDDEVDEEDAVENVAEAEAVMPLEAHADDAGTPHPPQIGCGTLGTQDLLPAVKEPRAHGWSGFIRLLRAQGMERLRLQNHSQL